MNCKKCGKPLEPTDKVCSNCGEPVNFQENSTKQADKLSYDNTEKTNKHFSKNNIIIIVLIILVLIIAIIGIFTMTKKPSNTNNSNENNTNNPSNNNIEKIPSENPYSFKDFEFSVPQNYFATLNTDHDTLELIDTTEKVLIEATIRNLVPLEKYKAVSNDIENDLINQGVTKISVSERNISNVDWYIINGVVMNEDEQVNIVETFATLDDYHVLEIMIGNYGDKLTDEILNDLSIIIRSGIYRGTNTYTPDTEKQPPVYNVNINILDKTKFELYPKI